MLRLGLTVLMVVAATSRAGAQCDPYSSETEVPIPKQLRLQTTCGNGRIDTYAVSCTKHASGGCGFQSRTTTACDKTQETCDGRALGSSSCAKLGYAGGRLRCAAGCSDFDPSGCTLCPSGTTCRERRVSAFDFEDLVLMAQGETVRAYWADRKNLSFAEVNAKAELVHTKVLAPQGTWRVIPIQVGSSAMVTLGPDDKPELAIVKANGDVTHQPLAGRLGTQMFMPIVPALDRPLAVIIVGDFFSSPNLIVVDETGAARPPVPMFARNEHRTVVLAPLAPGKHHAKWDVFEDDFVAEKDDLLFVMSEHPRIRLGVVRGGVVVSPFKRIALAKGMNESSTGSRDVVLDGQAIMTFNAAEESALGQHHSIIAVEPTRVFAAHAYETDVEVARTSTVEVQAARVPPAINVTAIDPDHPPDETLVVFVRKP